MIDLDDELAQEYLAECHEHLAAIETDLLAIEKGGPEMDENLVDLVFRSLHWIKGGAGVFDLVKVAGLAERMEDLMALIRSHTVTATPDRIRVLLRAADRLRGLIQSPGVSNRADTVDVMAALASLCAQQRPSGEKSHLRMLLVEDDFASRLLLQTFLSRYGECHVAVNGREAVEAFRAALERGQRYDLICMDIMMPEMDGREAVRQVRALEEEHGILSTSGAKIVMTTAVDDVKEVIRCFKELCDAYLIKPIDLAKLLDQMKSFQLVQ